jgi:hypothetical protein
MLPDCRLVESVVQKDSVISVSDKISPFTMPRRVCELYEVCEISGVTYDPKMLRQSASRAPPVPLPQVMPLAFLVVTEPTATTGSRPLLVMGSWMDPSPLRARKPP